MGGVGEGGMKGKERERLCGDKWTLAQPHPRATEIKIVTRVGISPMGLLLEDCFVLIQLTQDPTPLPWWNSAGYRTCRPKPNFTF